MLGYHVDDRVSQKRFRHVIDEAVCLRRADGLTDMEWVEALSLARRVLEGKAKRYSAKVENGTANLGERRRFRQYGDKIKRADQQLARPLVRGQLA